jgi:hypothetical protein
VYLFLAVWAGIHILINTPVSSAFTVVSGIAIVMQLIFLIGGISQMSSTTQEFSRPEFVGYLVGSLAIPPAVMWWTRNDKQRTGAGVLCLVFLVMPVLIIRIQQVWDGSYV